MSKIKVGNSIWHFDVNRRVYAKDNNYSGGPIWLEHWVEYKITGETSRSWILSHGIKLSKNDSSVGWKNYALDRAEIERRAYIEENSLEISRLVRDCTDYSALLQIASLVYYK